MSILKAEHQRIKKTLHEIQLETVSLPNKEKLLIEFAKQFYSHLRREEKNFYLPLLEKSTDWEKMLKSFDEHASIEKSLEKILLTTNHQEWLAIFTEFSKNVFIHIKNEETIVFNLAKKTFTIKELKHYGELYSEKKAHSIN